MEQIMILMPMLLCMRKTACWTTTRWMRRYCFNTTSYQDSPECRPADGVDAKKNHLLLQMFLVRIY